MIEKDFHEMCVQEAIRSDATESILRNVKVLGTISQNNRRYTLEAKQAGLGLYDGAKVNINHPDNPHKTRDFQDRFGVIRHPRIEGEDVFGDLHYNPAHPLAESVKWWANNMPNMLGLSHNAVGQGKDDNGTFIVEKIVTVRSVDLVADPATTKGLFEATMPNDIAPADATATPPPVTPPVAAPPEAESFEWKIGHLVSEIVKDPSLSKKDKRRKLLTALKLLDTSDVPAGEPEPEPEPPVLPTETPVGEGKIPTGVKGTKTVEAVIEKTPVKDATVLTEAAIEQSRTNVTKLEAELAQYKTAQVKRKNVGVAQKLCQEAALPKELITGVFLDRLTSAKSEKEMKALIEDRRSLVGGKPKPAPKKTDMSIEDFMNTLRRA